MFVFENTRLRVDGISFYPLSCRRRGASPCLIVSSLKLFDNEYDFDYEYDLLVQPNS